MQDYFRIGEISRLYGIGVDSLRYYERIGILKPLRAESGYRYYSIDDIWKLNTIRDLRGLGFGMEEIRTYLEHHTVDATLSLLEREQRAIDDKILELRQLRENVTRRMDTIHSALQRPLGQVREEVYPDRRCFTIPEGYSQECEMDVLIKRLMNLDKTRLYVIGSNQIGTAVSLEEVQRTGKIRYSSVFVIDGQGENVLPGGRYLTWCYRGDYSRSREGAGALLRYAESQGIGLTGDILELLWIDIHTSEQLEEHITELQVLTK